MKKLILLGVVSLLAVAAFFIPDSSGYIWTPIISSMVVVGLFYLALTGYIIQKSQSTSDRVLGIGILVLLTALSIYSGTSNYEKGEYQLNILMEIRKTIERGIMMVHMQEPLLKTLKAYYPQKEGSTGSIESLFKEKYGDYIDEEEGKLRFVPEGQEDNRDEPPFLYYQETGDENSVVLVGQSSFVEGRDSTFVNFNGIKGQMQFRAVLTPKGVEYDREN